MSEIEELKFKSINYENFASRFPSFTTNDSKLKNNIELIIKLSRFEIDQNVWQDLAVEGLFNLVACKISSERASDLQAKLGQIELVAAENSASSNTTSTSTNTSGETSSELQINLSKISKISVQDEYVLELAQDKTSDSSKSSSKSGSSLGNYKTNYFCQEYERLLNLVGTTPLYSGE